MNKVCAVAVVGVLALSGCGGGNATATSHPTTAPVDTVTQTPTDTPTETPTPEASPGGDSVDSCDYLLDPHYRFVAQSEITNTGNIDVKAKVVVTWKQVGAKAITRTQFARVNVGQTETVNFDVKATMGQIDQIQAYTGSENCKVTVAMVDVYGVAR